MVAKIEQVLLAKIMHKAGIALKTVYDRNTRLSARLGSRGKPRRLRWRRASAAGSTDTPPQNSVR